MSLHDRGRFDRTLRVCMTRRRFLRAGVRGGAAAVNVLALVRVARSQMRTLKVGYIAALSGVRANFGETTPWAIERIRTVIKNGLRNNGTSYPIELVTRDNQSDPARSSLVASELILRERCDLILCFDSDAAAATGELADARRVPTISTNFPWTGWKLSRGATQGDLVEKSFPYTFHVFWGVNELARNFLATWNNVATNKVAGTFYLDSSTGRALSSQKLGLGWAMAQNGYREVQGGFFKMATDDFSNQITIFKNGNAQIVSGSALPTHWATFWNEAAQAGYNPEVCTMAGAFLFASAAMALGPRGDGMSTEVWWTPRFPYRSSLTSQTARELADEWETTTGRQWTQPIGYSHAIWEVGFAALASAADPKDRDAVRHAISDLNVDTIVGPVKFKDSPIKNVALTSLAGGQWRRAKNGRFPYALVIVSNATAPQIPAEAPLKLLSQLA